jgi:hypothetical protein
MLKCIPDVMPLKQCINTASCQNIMTCKIYFSQVMVDWDEFLDNQSGRKFYYNTITKEKSWKPPRKIKGSMGEGKQKN